MIEHIPNIKQGACASIVLYQFIKSTPGLTYDDLIEFAREVNASVNSETSRYIASDINDMKCILNPYFTSIRNNSIDIIDMPNGENKVTLSESLPFLCPKNGVYGVICYFNRCMFYLQTGLQVYPAIGKNINEYTASIDMSFFNRYTEFIHRKINSDIIPYMSYMYYYDDNNIITNKIHVIIIIRNIARDEFFMINSNYDRIEPEDTYYAIYYAEDF